MLIIKNKYLNILIAMSKKGYSSNYSSGIRAEKSVASTYS